MEAEFLALSTDERLARTKEIAYWLQSAAQVIKAEGDNAANPLLEEA